MYNRKNADISTLVIFPIMYELLNANVLTVIIIVGSIMVTPFYVLAVYVFSGASPVKGAIIGTGFLIFGSFMFWVCLSGTVSKLGLGGELIVPISWIIPSLILFLKRQWFLSEKLSQQWLISLQLFRVIGAVFLIEMLMGNIPGIFAYPAGIGDILVSIIALIVLLLYKNSKDIPKAGVLIVIIVGVIDFLSAFFFGFTSSESPFQIFFPEIKNNVILFPTGMIPLFLVPYAIFFHTLSYLNFKKFGFQDN